MRLNRRRFVTGCAACAALMESSQVPAASVPAWESLQGPGFALRYVGRMRDVLMHGRREGILSLRELRHSGHPYGLGPVAELRGEVVMVDGRILVSVVDAAGGVRVSEVEDVSVPFFVWADVQAWQPVEVGPAMATLEQLAQMVGEAGRARHLGDAFPFLVSGRFQSLAYHVMDGIPGAPAGMEAHRRMQRHFTVHDAQATLVGFWSNRHQGVFTHAGSQVHVHFVAGDVSSAGHVEQLAAAAGALTLQLPDGSQALNAGTES